MHLNAFVVDCFNGIGRRACNYRGQLVLSAGQGYYKPVDVLIHTVGDLLPVVFLDSAAAPVLLFAGIMTLIKLNRVHMSDKSIYTNRCYLEHYLVRSG